jgi:mannosyltransferase
MTTTEPNPSRVAGQGILADILSAVVLVGAVVGSWMAYGRSDLTLDEGYTSAETQLHLGSLLKVLWSRELNGSLHTLLMWSFDRPGPTLLRLTSTIFMVAALALLHRFARARLGHWPAFVSLVLAATNPAIQEDMVIGRTYALSMLLVMTSFLLLEAAVRHGGTMRFVRWGSLSGFMLYAHFLTGLVVAAQVLWLVVFYRARIREWVAGLVAGLVLLIPIGLFFFSGGASHGQLLSVPPRSVGALVANGLEVLAGYARVATATEVVVVLLVAGVSALGLATRSRRVAALGVFSFAVPVATLAFGAQFASSLFSERYLVFAVPGVAIAVGAGIRECLDRSARLTLVTTTLLTATSVVFCLVVTVSLANAPWTQRHPWSAATRTIGTGQTVTTAVPAEGYIARFYAQQYGAIFVPEFPETAAAFLAQSAYDDRTCAGLARPIGPLWVASTMSQNSAGGYRNLARCINFRPTGIRTYGSVRVAELLPTG